MFGSPYVLPSPFFNGSLFFRAGHSLSITQNMPAKLDCKHKKVHFHLLHCQFVFSEQQKTLVQLSIMLFVYRFIHASFVPIGGCALQNIIDVGLQRNGVQAVGHHLLILGGGSL